jgi:nucleoside-diphosphate-sugar epimerase
MSWLITGSTGFIGRTLLRSLIKDLPHHQGHFVLLVRSIDKITPLLSPLKPELRTRFHIVKGDLDNTEGLETYLPQIKGVMHIAGLVDARLVESFNRVNTVGTQKLHQQVMKAHPEAPIKWIQISSIAANGPVSMAAQDRRPEIDQNNPVSQYGKSKLSADLYLKQNHSLDHLVIVRPPAVFGKEDRAWIPVIKMIRRRMIPIWTGKSCPYFSFIDVDSLVNLLRALMTLQKPIHETVYPTFDQPVHWNQLLSMTRLALNIQNQAALPIPVSAGLTRALARSLEIMARVPIAGQFFAYGGDKLRLVGSGHLVKDGRGQLAKLGVEAPKDMAQLWSQCVQHWKETGVI